MADIISYSGHHTTIGSPDATITMDPPIRTENSQGRGLRLLKLSFTSLLPNVYQYGSFNNGLVGVTRDGGTTWTTIQLPNGVYSAAHIENGINSAISDWYTDAADPGFKVRYNLASQLFYVDIDSTKLVAPGTQLGIDLSLSSMWDLLGFPLATCTFVTDGLHGATNYAKMNRFGDSVSVLLHGFGTLSRRNGRASEELCVVPLSVTNVTNEYIYPNSGIVSPFIPLRDCPQIINSFGLEFLGSRVDSAGHQVPIVIMEGNVDISFEFAY